jgi:multicomponent Na+:H+ antiporter subunit E
MTAKLAAVAWMTLVWVALWGEPSVANLLGGVAVGTLLLVAFPVPATGGGGRVRPLALARLLADLAWRLVKANVIIARASVSPVHQLVEGVVAVPLVGASEALVTFVANAISLTPGTLVLEVRAGDPTWLFVHVLGLREMETEAIRQDVQRLEAAVVRALGSADAVAALERPAATGGAATPGSPP